MESNAWEILSTLRTGWQIDNLQICGGGAAQGRFSQHRQKTEQ
jgi:hypothetical protein